MNKLNNIKKSLLAIIVCIPMLLCGCQTDNEVVIDYGDAESFEAALNDGENLEDKIVRFTVSEIHPDSAFGYNVCAGEHLNFVSERNPDIKVNDTVTVRAAEIKSLMGSWIISYEKVENAVIDENTITYDKPAGAAKLCV